MNPETHKMLKRKAFDRGVSPGRLIELMLMDETIEPISPVKGNLDGFIFHISFLDANSARAWVERKRNEKDQ